MFLGEEGMQPHSRVSSSVGVLAANSEPRFLSEQE